MKLCHPVFEIFPLLVHIPPFRSHVNKLRPLGRKIVDYMMKKVESSKQRDDSSNFVKQYIEMNSSSGYDAKELAFIIRDLYGAGTETVATVIDWALVLLGNRPKILEKLYKEIDSVVPRDRLPSLYDKNKLPYLEATMLEIFRYRSVAALAVPHLTTCDTSVSGYHIPKGTHVMINLWSAHMDPAIWTDPEVFRPDRFIDDNDNIINQDLMIIFSLGKRACLGETLARQETFLFLSAILQQFNILPPEGENKIIEEDDSGIVLAPAAYTLCLVPRL